MERKKKSAKKPEFEWTDRKQTNLAEGERETVEESIRIHEQKKDVQGQPAPQVRRGSGTA